MKNNEFYLGWQVGISYESPEPEGAGLDKMLGLLDEMARHEMNLISLMMTGYAYFDPGHDGFCWPVNNARLECLRDANCRNANERTEFVTKVIEMAAGLGIDVQLFTNLAIYNPGRARGSYPGACEQTTRNGEVFRWLFCPDSHDAWQLEKDEIMDLLAFYNKDAKIHSIGYERLSYAGGSCHCKFTQQEFHKDTGMRLEKFRDDDPFVEKWKADNITGKIAKLNKMIKSSGSGIETWLHTSCAPGWGHDPKRLKAAGIDCVVPHIAHFPMNRGEFNALLDGISPNDIVLHFCVRSRALQNYGIWEKTPRIIGQIGEWIHEYRRDNENLKGILFFNENTVSDENREAVYRLADVIMEKS
ncbi:MAG: hypothetical protein JXB33_02360 [Clostridia bacterium]|nr:hypothetical protein [Clostridia bacterium]